MARVRQTAHIRNVTRFTLMEIALMPIRDAILRILATLAVTNGGLVTDIKRELVIVPTIRQVAITHRVRELVMVVMVIIQAVTATRSVIMAE